MDPLSISASILAIIGAVQKVQIELKPYYKAWTEYPNDVQDIKSELVGLEALLQTVKASVVRLGDNERSNPALVQLRTSLSYIDTHIKEIEILLEPNARGRSWKDRFDWKGNRVKVLGFKDKIALHRAELELGLAASTSSGVADANEKLGTLEEKVKESIDDEKQHKILEWLFSADPGTRHVEIQRRREQDTGMWLFDLENFKRWYSQHDYDSWLLCQGAAGVGKTFIMSHVVDHIINDIKGSEVAIAYIYCTFALEASNSTEIFFESILKQLTRQKKDEFPPEVLALYTKHQTYFTRPTLHELSCAIKKVAVKFKRVFLLFDALDECSENTRGSLLSTLHSLRGPGIKVFATSRPHVDDVQHISKHGITIDLSVNRNDLEQVIRKKVEHRTLVSPSRSKDLDETFTTWLVDSVMERSKGMFLLAGYQTDHILQGINKTEMIKNLKHIPQDVTAFFAETLERINRQDDFTKTLAFNVLKWVSAATRPIHIDELRTALSIERGYDIKTEIYSRKNLDSVCIGLVIIEEYTNLCSLAHYTVLEYFRDKRPDFLLEAHSFIARTCLACLKALSHPGYESRWTRPYTHRVLYDYAAMNWATHMKSAREPQDIIDLVMMNFKDNKDYMDVAMSVTVNTLCGISRSLTNRIPSDSIHTAAFWGLTGLAKKSLTLIEDPNVEDGYKRTPLSWAAQNGHKDVVQLLIEANGVDIDRQSGFWGETPLSHAAMNGHEDVVGQLLETNRIIIGRRNYREPHNIPQEWDIAWDNSILQRQASTILEVIAGDPTRYGDMVYVMQYLSGTILKDITQFTFQRTSGDSEAFYVRDFDKTAIIATSCQGETGGRATLPQQDSEFKEHLKRQRSKSGAHGREIYVEEVTPSASAAILMGDLLGIAKCSGIGLIAHYFDESETVALIGHLGAKRGDCWHRKLPTGYYQPGHIWVARARIHYHRLQCGPPRRHTGSPLDPEIYKGTLSTAVGDGRFIRGQRFTYSMTTHEAMNSSSSDAYVYNDPSRTRFRQYHPWQLMTIGAPLPRPLEVPFEIPLEIPWNSKSGLFRFSNWLVACLLQIAKDWDEVLKEVGQRMSIAGTIMIYPEDTSKHTTTTWAILAPTNRYSWALSALRIFEDEISQTIDSLDENFPLPPDDNRRAELCNIFQVLLNRVKAMEKEVETLLSNPPPRFMLRYLRESSTVRRHWETATIGFIILIIIVCTNFLTFVW